MEVDGVAGVFARGDFRRGECAQGEGEVDVFARGAARQSQWAVQRGSGRGEVAGDRPFRGGRVGRGCVQGVGA